MTRRLLAALVLGVAMLGAAPIPPASAHATVLFTTPAADGAVPTSPTQIQLVFNEPVTPDGPGITLLDADGRSYAVGPPQSDHGGQTVTARLLETLGTGEYQVTWQATAPDGDAMTGQFRFAVGSTSGLSLQSATTSATKGLSTNTGLRWLLFLGFAIAFGGMVGDRFAKRSSDHRHPDPPPWLLGGAVTALVAAVGLALLVAGGGSLSQGLSQFDPDTFLTTRPGLLAWIEVVALALAVSAFALGRTLLGALPLAALPVAEGLRAHPESAAPGWGAVLIAIHLLAAGIWMGALVHVIRVGRSRHRSGSSAAPAVLAYARLVLWLFLAVLATGVINGLVLLGTGDLVHNLTRTTYGKWLLVKLALVLVVAVSALVSRRHLVRRPQQTQPARMARVESVVLVGVLGLSGLLTSLAPPVRGNLALPFPPPAVGPVTAVGGRAGWIGLGLTASAGQLVVRLTTPDDDQAQGTGSAPRFSLAGNLVTGARTEPTPLELRACGDGCFVAAVSWTRGLSTVTLRASSATWPGGSTSVPLAWPPRPGPELLTRAVAAMRQTGSFELHERVTSDTRQGLGSAHVLRLTGKQFLAAESYSSGVAPIVNVLDQDDGQIALALAFPAEGTYVRLTLGPDGRILRETLTAPNHLVTRTFVYPGAEE